MRICLVTPAPPRSRNGNRNTATRWARFLRELGHAVTIEQQWSGAGADVLIALHARRSHGSIRAYADAFPDRPLIVALTGTDLYRDIRSDAGAKESLRLAKRLVVLQELGARELPAGLRRKVRVVYQSAPRLSAAARLTSCFEVVVSGHLREEKDPFRAVAALRALPVGSRIRVTHIGGALSAEMAREARAWMAREPRYRWRGELPRGRALRVLARARLIVVSSIMEGGANVVSEALACGVPVIASRIPGNLGMLGRSYPGYFPVGDERALARLLLRAESDPTYYDRLRVACRSRAPLVTAARERRALEQLVNEVATPAVRKPARARAAA